MSVCLSVRVQHLLALQPVDTANCLLVRAQPKVLHSNDDIIKLRHVINFKKIVGISQNCIQHSIPLIAADIALLANSTAHCDAIGKQRAFGEYPGIQN